MDLNNLIQNISQITSYIDTVISDIDNNIIGISDISVDTISSFINSNISSQAVSFDPTRAFLDSVNTSIVILTYAIKINDANLALACLDLIVSQLNSFMKSEAGWCDKLGSDYSAYCLEQYELSKIANNDSINLSDKKGVVYTAIIGDYDDLMDPDVVNPKWDYICFTDNTNIHSDIWKVIYVDNDGSLDNIRLARKYKLLPHLHLPEYDYSIWIDGQLKIKGDFTKLLNAYMHGDILCFPHHIRDCIYDEAEVCMELGRGSKAELHKQISRYEAEGFPHHYGLVETGILIRFHNLPSVINLMNDWWTEILNESTRDQVSFEYVCRKNNYKYDLCPYNINDNPFCIIRSHKK